MTETDVRIVEQNAHFQHYLFDLLRVIEEGIPVSSLVVMGINAEDNNTAHMEQRIADELLRLTRRYDHHCECAFGIGDRLKCHTGYEECGRSFTVADFVTVENDGKYYDAVVLMGDKDHYPKPLVVPTQMINANYELYEKDKHKA